MKKRILSILLAALMIVSLLPVTAFASGNGSITVKNLSDQDMKLTLGTLVATSDNDLSYEPEGAPWPYACGENEQQEFTVAPGKTITFSYFYRSRDPFNTEEPWFTCDKAYAVSGDLDDFLPANCHVESAFDSNLVDASGLIFPKNLTGRDIADIFNGCSNLVKGPSLPATNLSNYCYSQMFFNCSKLSSLTVGFNSFGSGLFTYGWLYGVASTGTIYVNGALRDEINGQGFTRSTSTVPEGWTVVGPKSNQSAPNQGAGYTLDYAAETMVAADGYEVSSTNGDTATALTDNKVTPGNTYYVRLKETDTLNASSWTANTIPARPAKADTPVLASKTETSATVTAVAGQEYSINSGTTWVSDGGAGDGDATTGTVTFSDLTKGETYSIITRTKAVTDGSKQFAGVNSDALSVTAEAAGNTPSGNAIYSFDFETDPFSEANGWKNIDADSDGYGWNTDTVAGWSSNLGINGSHCAVSMSYFNKTGARQANNWMFSPAITIPAGGAKVSWYEKSQDNNYPDSYTVYASETNTSTDPNGMTVICATHKAAGSSAGAEVQTIETWTQKTVELPAKDYAGKTVYIAFQHQDYDRFYIKIDNFAVEALAAPATCTYTVTFPEGPEQVYIVGTSAISLDDDALLEIDPFDYYESTDAWEAV